MKPGKLYLIPSNISSASTGRYLPEYNLEVIKKLSTYFVEKERSARRFISGLKININIESLTFYLLNKDTDPASLKNMIRLILNGIDAGIISEAGNPGIADPGSSLVALAHKHKINIVPLVGPSAILLALIASGFNGQKFAFTGYLPIRENERQKKIRELESTMYRNNQTQIFMETPYRNNQLIKDLLNSLKPETLLCVACDITGPGEMIKTQTVIAWKKEELILDKIPAMFLIYHPD